MEASDSDNFSFPISRAFYNGTLYSFMSSAASQQCVTVRYPCNPILFARPLDKYGAESMSGMDAAWWSTRTSLSRIVVMAPPRRPLGLGGVI